MMRCVSLFGSRLDEYCHYYDPEISIIFPQMQTAIFERFIFENRFFYEEQLLFAVDIATVDTAVVVVEHGAITLSACISS